MKDEYDFKGGKRGAVLPIPTGKSLVTIRVDNNVLDWFRQKADDAGDGNYETLINQALRAHIAHETEPRPRF